MNHTHRVMNDIHDTIIRVRAEDAKTLVGADKNGVIKVQRSVFPGYKLVRVPKPMPPEVEAVLTLIMLGDS